MDIYLVIGMCFLFIFIKFLNKLWRTPNRTQVVMASQGIKGPRYRFLHGSTKELIRMRSEAMAAPMELSHDIVGKVMPHTYSWMKLYGKSFLHWIGPQAQLVVTDPEVNKAVLNNKDGAFQKAELPGHTKKLVGDGLVTSKGEKWHKQRKLANHAFHAESLRSMTPAMIVSVEMMLERWRKHVGKEIEVHQEFKLLSSESISRTAFGSSYAEGENIFLMLTELAAVVCRTDYNIRIPGMGKFVKTSDDMEAERLERGIRESVIKLIRKREEMVTSGEAKSYGSDFLGLLVSAHHSDDASKKISVDDMVDETKTFYLAGQETTLSLLTWALLLLAINPDWQAKARDEVFELFGFENPNAQGIARLTNMGMIINETLRLYSPVASVARTTTKDVKLGDLILPANMGVLIPSIVLHHNPEIWGDDVHMFKPERFDQGVAKATNNKIAAYIPFRLGPRFCVGQNFATNEAKIALSMILQRYKFTLSPNYLHSPVEKLTILPQYGMQIILHPL